MNFQNFGTETGIRFLRPKNGIWKLLTTPGSEYPGRGVAILGDSAGAHFAIPNNWMRPTKFNSTTFENLLMILTRILKTVFTLILLS